MSSDTPTSEKGPQPGVIIVGAGLAGLSCAIVLQQHGIQTLILEASDGVGGRMRTDKVHGFQLDRGFQVLLTAYPECRAQLNYPALKLHRFDAGASIFRNGKFYNLCDPLRSRLIDGLKTVFSPLATWGDKFELQKLRSHVCRGTAEGLFRKTDSNTLSLLRMDGFSSEFIESFFRPFFAGIFLEPDLKTSSHLFEFVFRMFSQGYAALPHDGMEAIPRQLASRLMPGTIHLQQRVAEVSANGVVLDNGQVVKADRVVLATPWHDSAMLLDDTSLATIGSKSVSCVYFAAPESPVLHRRLLLNGELDAGPVNNMCVPSLIAPSYAPEGYHLISLSILGDHSYNTDIEMQALHHMRQWFGDCVDDWQHIHTYAIRHALPECEAGSLQPVSKPLRHDSGVYLCGDYRHIPSIHGALASGRQVAETLCLELAHTVVSR